jgi:hypothetical protein
MSEGRKMVKGMAPARTSSERALVEELTHAGVPRRLKNISRAFDVHAP